MEIVKVQGLLNVLNDIVAKNPEAREFDLIYAIDDEGNAFKPVLYDAQIAHYCPDDADAYIGDEIGTNTINAVLLN